MICIYHSKDLDGFTSGAIVTLKYPDAKLIGYDYGQPFSFTPFSKDEDVIMIDVSLPMDDMFMIANLSKSFTWIDHHVSAINDYKKHDTPNGITAVLEDGLAACEGGWKYLFPDRKMPLTVKLLGEYDTWRNKDIERWNSTILPFQFGMRILCSSPQTFDPYLFTDNFQYIDSIIEKGKTIIEYESQVNSLQCSRASFEVEFKGLRAICLNGGGFNSGVFKSVYDESKHDVMMPFQFNGKFWTFSLYTTKDEVDCSVIAKSMGGGGHKKAAGFKVEDITEVFSNLFQKV